MTEKVKFTQVSRVICPKTGIHFLDAVDTEGFHWTAQQETGREPEIIGGKFTPDQKELTVIPDTVIVWVNVLRKL